MALSEKQRKALQKARKKRGTRPTPVVTPSPSLTMKNRQRDRFTNSHAHVLLGIERAIVAQFAIDASLEDRTVAKALETLILGQTPDDSVRELCERLQVVEKIADSEQTWIDGMRAINTSVESYKRQNSSGRDYLFYARSFVKKATAA